MKKYYFRCRTTDRLGNDYMFRSQYYDSLSECEEAARLRFMHEYLIDMKRINVGVYTFFEDLHRDSISADIVFLYNDRSRV